MALEPIEFEKLPKYKPDYEHMKCGCGGTIGCYDRDHFTCSDCNKEYDIFALEYDRVVVNSKTGWSFPVKYKEEPKCH